MKRILIAAAICLSAAFAQSQWKSLFDGKSFAGWRDVRTLQVPGNGWTIEDGAIHSTSKPWINEDLFSLGEYTDFELEFEWKVSPRGNSGVKYRLQDAVFLNESLPRPSKKFEDTLRDEYERHPSDRAKLKPNEHGQLYTVAFEFQLIDDNNYSYKLKDNQQTGALYSFIKPSQLVSKKPGEWNTAKLVVKGDHVEHWVNGVKVVDASLKSPVIAEGAKARWGDTHPVYKLLTEQPKKKSPILLQNHGDEAWFRNLRVRSL
ncbi:3-keto-disaccharide hydrolase [Bryobacter aggregatus]|uniref:3-keto-disaccharide hydrolase n=1 Tax=Bryobacter aggregatus TaxID=360054 RepID=UPI0006898963|nr:DUF1080 domain-containing protein [Bryobacter aggregatus]